MFTFVSMQRRRLILAGALLVTVAGRAAVNARHDVFVASLMIISGLQIILGSKPDARRPFVIGIPLIFGLSLLALPEVYAQVVPWLRPLFGSALTLSTVLAVLLNLLLHVGGTKGEDSSAASAEG